MERRFFTTNEVAEALRVGPPTVRNWIKRGVIKTVRVGHEYLIAAYELERLIANPFGSLPVASGGEQNV